MGDETSAAARLLRRQQSHRPKRTLIDQWRESCADDIQRNLFDEYCRDFVRLRDAGKILFGVPVLLQSIEEDERIDFIDVKSSTMQAHLNRVRMEMAA